MSAVAHRRDLARLVALTSCRRERASVALAAARAELARLECVRDEQLELIGSMREAIDALGATRPSAGRVSAEALTLETRRRRWLLFDVRKEEFYLDTMLDDVVVAEEVLEVQLREWREAGTRLEQLEALGVELSRVARIGAARREDAAVAELGTNGSASRGPGAPGGTSGGRGIAR